MIPTEAEPFFRRIQHTAALILGLAGAASLLTSSPQFTFGLVCGGLLSLFNFRLLYRQTCRVLDQGSRAKFFMQSRYFARIGLSAIIVFALITRTEVNIVGLLLGLSIIILSITGQALATYIAQGGDI